MALIADPMDGLLSFQHALNTGMTVNRLHDGYVERYDEISSGVRYSYALIVGEEVHALATFGSEEPINNVECYSVNYAVVEKHRRRGLAIKIFNKGIEELKKRLGQNQVNRFYVDAVIDMANIPSIKLAEKLFSAPGKKMIENDSGRSALYFRKLIDASI